MSESSRGIGSVKSSESQCNFSLKLILFKYVLMMQLGFNSGK